MKLGFKLAPTEDAKAKAKAKQTTARRTEERKRKVVAGGKVERKPVSIK